MATAAAAHPGKARRSTLRSSCGARPGQASGATVGTFRVTLIESEQGFSVSCPDLPGCRSQGVTRKEALENIRDAIREWLDVAEAEDGFVRFSETEVTV